MITFPDIHFKCHPVIWAINFFGCIAGIAFNLVVFADSLERNWLAGIFFSLIICIGLFYQCICMPFHIIIHDDTVRIKWPWWTIKVRKDDVRRLILKQRQWKTVYIVIQRNNSSVLNWFPMLAIWELKPDDSLNIASALQEWWNQGSGVMTNREASLRRVWY